MEKQTVAERQLNNQIEDLDGYQRRREELRYYTIECLEPVFADIGRHILFKETLESTEADLAAAETLATISLALDRTYTERIEEAETTIDRLREQVDRHYLNQKEYEEYEAQEAERLKNRKEQKHEAI